MNARPLTPSTLTHTSLKDRPGLRFALWALWFLVFFYIVYIVGAGLFEYADRFSSNSNSLLQIARIGFNLFTVSAIDLGSDLYIFLGYFTLAVIVFIQRSDDWFAIFLSIMIVTFGVRVTSIAAELAGADGSSYLVSPIVMMGEVGIVLLGWLYPDGRFFPRWARYLVPLLVLNMALFYWPASPLYAVKLSPMLVTAVSLGWYLASGNALIARYRSVINPNQRQQIRWVFTGMVASLVWFILFNVPPLLFPSLRAEGTLTYLVFQLVMRLLGIVLFLALPASIVIAIARYRLFDIDLFIHRAFVYGALTILLASVFALVTILVTAVLNLVLGTQDASIGVAVSALAAGALFQPARKALVRLVDRTVYNIRIDYLKTPPGPRTRPGTETTAQAPVLFSRFRNLSLIGKGGMAEVYYAEHPQLRRAVAVKVLLANLAEDPQFLKRFQREARILSEIEHPRIVRIHEFGEENGLHYFVMEYLNGMNLSAVLKRQGRIDFDELVPILRDVANALDYAHAAGLVHRDIKPSNVMLDEQDGATRAVLTDFGIVKVSTSLSNITATGMVGTFDYIAPEQIQAQADVDGRADVYSLGVMTYQLLTGVLPYHRNSAGAILLAHMTAPPPDARETTPGLSLHAARAIQRAMAKFPEDRYASAGDFVRALA